MRYILIVLALTLASCGGGGAVDPAPEPVIGLLKIVNATATTYDCVEVKMGDEVIEQGCGDHPCEPGWDWALPIEMGRTYTVTLWVSDGGVGYVSFGPFQTYETSPESCLRIAP